MLQEFEAAKFLTAHNRWQLVQGIAKGEVRYEGDPDLAPITHRWVFGKCHWLI